MIQRFSAASEPALGALRASSRSIRPRNESVAFSVTLTARSSLIVHSVAIHDQSMTAPSFSARMRARKRALRQPPDHQSGTGFPAALQRCVTSERFVSAAVQTRRSISVESGRRVNVFTVPAATRFLAIPWRSFSLDRPLYRANFESTLAADSWLSASADCYSPPDNAA